MRWSESEFKWFIKGVLTVFVAGNECWSFLNI